MSVQNCVCAAVCPDIPRFLFWPLNTQSRSSPKNDVVVTRYLEISPGNAKYTLPTIQNELLGVMSDIFQKESSAEIQEAVFYRMHSKQCNPLLPPLEEVAGEDRNHAVEARGILHKVNAFHFILCLFTFDLSITNAFLKIRSYVRPCCCFWVSECYNYITSSASIRGLMVSYVVGFCIVGQLLWCAHSAIAKNI